MPFALGFAPFVFPLLPNFPPNNGLLDGCVFVEGAFGVGVAGMSKTGRVNEFGVMLRKPSVFAVLFWPDFAKIESGAD